MRLMSWRRTSVLALTCAWTVLGQTKIDLRTQTKSVDFSGASATKPAQMGASLPASCGQGEFFFLTSAPSGQNVYGCPVANTWAVEGSAEPQARLVPSGLDNAGGLLTTDGTNPIWQALSGDVSGPPSAVKVQGLMGRGLSAAVPFDGQLLKFNGTTGLWEPISVGGDVSGAPADLIVGGLLGRALSAAAPTDGELLKFNGTTGIWEPVALGGDVSGPPGALLVGGLLGRGLSAAAPTDGQLLRFNNGKSWWEAVSLGGDIAGNPPWLRWARCRAARSRTPLRATASC
jgi:hypothetical protein